MKNKLAALLLVLCAPVAGMAQTGSAVQSSIKWCLDESGSYVREGRVKACSDALDSGALTPPQVEQAHLNRVRLRLLSGQTKLALEELDELLRAQPRNATLLAERGAAYATLGNFSKAIADYNAALAVNPQADATRYQRGMAYERAGDFDQAIEDFSALAGHAAQPVPFLLARGDTYGAKGDYEHAIADYNAVLQRVQPGKTVDYGRNVIRLNFGTGNNALYRRGVMQFALGHYAPAAADFQTANDASAAIDYALWVYIAQRRGGMSEREAQINLKRNTHAWWNIPPQGWPQALIRLYTGEMREDAIVQAAGRAAGGVGSPELMEKQRQGRLCQAYFHIGEYHLQYAERREAKEAFNHAKAACAPASEESTAMRFEVAHLGR